MAEALVSAVLERLLSITSELAKQEVRLVKDVKKNVSSLRGKLEDIKAVLEDAERKQLEDASVRRWLEKLKDVSYHIDDVLDEWSSEILKSQNDKNHVEAQEGDQHKKANLVSNMKKKVCPPLLSSSCFCINQLKRVGVRNEIAHRIKELNETLEKIAKEKGDYSFETTKVVQKERRETISFVDESQVYGLDGPKNALIEKLLNESSSEGPGGPVIIPIVGMGGIGKTTLAQLAFNDANIKTHFQKRIWACVSDPFDEIKIAKAIIESLKGSHRNLETLEGLFQRIQESIEGKKFFLVLDDVWSDNPEKWEKFIQLFGYGAVGSRVVVTTRKKEVATMMGAATQMITLQLLSDECCWSIFSRLAFRERNSEECKKLERVGRQIASKCKGLPLVAKTLGALMCSKVTQKEWEDVVSSGIWELQDEPTKTFAPFFLSYYDLSPKERRCFSYCSVFPKDFEIARVGLIQMWMSQGYLSGSQNPEKEGEKCFQILTMRSFFQNFGIGFDGSIETCKMHDILHDFVQFLTRNECSIMTIYMDKTEPLSVGKVCHFTLLLAPNFPKIPTSIFGQHYLRSLLVRSISDTSLGDENMVFFQQTSCYLKHLRTLCLTSSNITKVPVQIGQLIHLRYLNLLESSNLQELADAVCDLRNLQTLIIQGCRQIQRLPEGMRKLVNLRHLYIRGCSALVGLPKGIGRLSQLRMLDTMIIPKKNEQAYFLSLGDLKKLTHLRFQRYNFEITKCCNLINMSEIALTYWECLVELYLNFGMIDKEEDREEENHEFGILEALQPHPSLTCLEIREYKGTNLCPKWMTLLVNLKWLRIKQCKQCESLPPLGSLPSLEELRFDGLDKVKRIGDEFLGLGLGLGVHQVSFPKLRRLEFYNMQDWEDWEGPAGTSLIKSVMPCLNFLRIENCGTLKSLPPYLKLTPLYILYINACWVLLQSLQNSEDQEFLKISHIPHIIIDGQEVVLSK